MDKVEIEIVVNNEEDILSSFSSKKPVISSVLSEYLESVITKEHIEKGVFLNIISNTIDENEKIIYSEAIRNSYNEKYVKARNARKRNNIISLSMLLFGVFVLITAFILDSMNKSSVLIEIYDIIAWVFIWKSVDIFFFKRFMLGVNAKVYKVLKEAEIIYNNN